MILEAGPEAGLTNEALMLVATGRIPRECKVQIHLIDLLCEQDADPDTAIRSAAVHDEHDSVRALLRHGAKLDLPVAAALGEETEFEHLPKVATPQDRHFALAFAAQFGYANIVRSLLDAGEDLDRYHPPGGHSHATPLHQAAAAGHEAVARAY